MRPNPVLHRLGFAPTDRVVILHADDIGMCQASVAAYRDLTQAGILSSAALMAPCPWFLEAAAYGKAYPHLDLGVHLTLNAEWQTYRWGPLSTRDPLSGLLDDEGCFPRTREQVREKADPAAVQMELTAQVERVLAAGIRPTHVDTHMGTVAHPRLIPAYLQVAVRHRLPAMIFRLDRAGWQRAGLDPDNATAAAQTVEQLEDSGLPLLDHLSGLPLDVPDERLNRAKQILSALEPGITHFICHPSIDTPELRSITPDWACRAADYQTFLQDDLRTHLKNEGIHVIGYRTLQELLPA